MRFCKYCGAEITENTEVCPVCGKYVGVSAKAQKSDSSEETAKRTKFPRKGILAIASAALVVVIIGIAVVAANSGRCAVSGCRNKVVPGMSYCYSHKCAVADCDEAKNSYSNYCSLHYRLYDDSATSSSNASDLKISRVSLSSNSSYTIAEGTITNNSFVTVKYVQIKGAFKDSSGSVIDTDWTYAVGSEGLAPGESCTWRMSVKKDSSIKSCDVSILDFRS